jgi:hypothetical protein
MDSEGGHSMSLAMKRLQNIGWFALVFFVAILLYPLSMNVASVHSDLVSVDNKIKNTKREISYLQAELRTRASMAQLQEWNDVLYGYAPPTAQQFLDGETALANLQGNILSAKPIMVSVNSSDGTQPAGIIGSPTAKMAFAGAAQSRSADDKSADEKIDARTAEMVAKPKQEGIVISIRTEQLASMDRKLLSDDFLNDIGKKSDAERKRR